MSSLPVSGAGSDVQALSLRVLCLTKPTFRLAPALVNEEEEIGGNVVLNYGADYSEGWEFGLSDFLLIPSTVPTFLVGETFRVYLSVHNHSPFDVNSVSIKADLQLQQAKAARQPLLDVTAAQIPTFPAGESNDFILQHVMTEGTFILVCRVTYVKHDGEKKQFPKFFRFTVENPLSIKNKLVVLGDSVFVESQITNNTKEALFLSRACVLPAVSPDDPNPPAPVPPLPFEKTGETEWSGFYLKASHAIQLLFQLVNPPSRGGSVGVLQIEWRGPLGNSGCVLSDQLRPKAQPKLGLHMYFSDVPSEIFLEEPFRLTCNVLNQSTTADANLVLFLLHQKMTGIVLSGTSGQALGKLGPQQTRSFPLTLFPLKPGVQKIAGLRFVDLTCDKRFDFDNHLQVCVLVRQSEQPRLPQ